ncbi:glycoside hydrolase [Paenibacillus sp. IHB B 3415]|uniref:beta-glucosidase n=1 Tax=Paenibacillus sp. IHB B 3415 TaxID=867080 RepID=UPI000574E09D|nr:beta-glucosidase [Paenibacillus sp. IHB B 3415]KHL97086.1 glycoside hydrolase [Paenibacillus sp. IHB B 3415]
MKKRKWAFRVMQSTLAAAVLLSPFQTASAAEAGSNGNKPWMNTALSAEDRTKLLLEAMDLQDTVDFITGNVNNYYGFYNAGNEEFGIPALTMADGPAGVRIANPDIQNKQSTAMPAPIALAASWDAQAAKKYGELLGDEAFNSTHNVLLGPGLDIARVPWGSRNFESLGEDPLLQSEMGAAYVKGIQSFPVIATAKHYLMNNQETERFTTDVKVSERAIQEIYTRPFAAAIEQSDLGSVMCSFNYVNSVQACDNSELLTDVLRNKLNFNGFVMSDYGANKSTTKSALAGLDLETPGEPFGKWGAELLTAVNNGEITETKIDEMATRILVQMFRKQLFDKPVENNLISAQAHGEIAREIAEQSMVLLKNDNSTLPLDSASLKSVAVIGPDADNASAAGGGSSLVNPTYTVSPLEGIKSRVGDGVTVNYAPGSDPISAGDIVSGPDAVPSSLLAPSGDSSNIGDGLTGEYFTNTKLEGEPTVVRTDKQVNMNLGFYNYEGFNSQSPKLDRLPTSLNAMMSARWTGNIVVPKTGEYEFSLTSRGSSQLYLDDKLLFENEGKTMDTTSFTLSLTAGEAHKLKIEYRTDWENMSGNDNGGFVRFGWTPPAGVVDPLIQKAVETAKEADTAIIVTRTYDSEGYFDRSDLELPNNQEQLIREVSAANPNTIVVQMSGRAVEMDNWQDQVPAVVQAWYAGQEQGNAVASILFGDVNPSGKLPVTFPVNEQTTPISTAAQFPGVNGVGDYSDGIFVGYRGYDKENLDVAYPFGHGLSYTTFGYSNLKTISKTTGRTNVQTLEVSLNLRNTGKVEGSEVVQVYAGKLPTAVETPEKQLAGFAKVDLKAGKQQRVTVELDAKAFSYWDESKQEWVMPSGSVPIYVGSSSEDIRLKGNIQIKGN